MIKQWILPTGNEFIKDPAQRHARPQGNLGADSLDVVELVMDLRKPSTSKSPTRTPRRSRPSRTRSITSTRTRKAASKLAATCCCHRARADFRRRSYSSRDLEQPAGRKERDRQITSFDTTAFSVTFAAEVKNFDPLQFVDKKEARKMGRFIHLALAATHEAMESSGLKIEGHNGERVGASSGRGSAASTSSSASTTTCCRAGRGKSLLFHSGRHH